MGGLGFYVLDLANPYDPQVAGHLALPLNVGGVEGDNVDTTRVESRSIVLANGYPMNEDCYEPYKDIFIINVEDPGDPRIVGTLPRPMPPAEAPYADFCLRGGKFGPKRPTREHAPGTAEPNITVYPFNNAGVQVFDIADSTDAKIVAYFVPTMTDDLNDPRSYSNPVESIFVEWDRKLIWAFANSGIYLLTTPALGKPQLGSMSK
jgi:hypothetical protein